MLRLVLLPRDRGRGRGVEGLTIWVLSFGGLRAQLEEGASRRGVWAG